LRIAGEDLMTSFKVSPPVLWLSGLGLISGLLSSIPPAAAERVTVLGVPIHPGALFGLVIAFGVYRWGKASWWAAVLALVVTAAAWIAAMRGFLAVTDDATRNIYLGGLVAGAIGAAGTMLGGAITLPALRRLPDWLLTVGVGAVAGLLVEPAARMPDDSFLLLFLVWQAAVAAVSVMH
jgi:hypothetical protein